MAETRGSLRTSVMARITDDLLAAFDREAGMKIKARLENGQEVEFDSNDVILENLDQQRPETVQAKDGSIYYLRYDTASEIPTAVLSGLKLFHIEDEAELIDEGDKKGKESPGKSEERWELKVEGVHIEGFSLSKLAAQASDLAGRMVNEINVIGCGDRQSVTRTVSGQGYSLRVTVKRTPAQDVVSDVPRAGPPRAK